jgi:urease accessory protein
MLRVTEILTDWNGAAHDHVALDYDDRHRRRVVLSGVRGTEFLLDLADVPDLRDGDGLRLSSGQVVLVQAAPEALLEIRCHDPLHLARIAWHLGNRHLATEITEDWLRIRADHVIAAMVEGLGGMAIPITAPFNPEGGAYAPGTQMRSHHHDDDHHDRDHAHGTHHHHD